MGHFTAQDSMRSICWGEALLKAELELWMTVWMESFAELLYLSGDSIFMRRQRVPIK